MLRTPKLLICLMVFCLNVAVIPQKIKAGDGDQPQMVWLNEAQGEVKFSPGHGGKALGDEWIQANPGQTMEDGYTLATEKGRAEVEFENGTVVYLAENSVLQFKKLRMGTGSSDTRLNLLTGTATIAHVSRGHDVTQMETPTTNMKLGGDETVRVESTLNGMAVQAVEGEVTLAKGKLKGNLVLKPGESAAYVDGLLMPLKELNGYVGEDEWDQWVKQRLAERKALVEEGMKESGLNEPIPGLAGMMKTGRFYDCPPYGKCWEPVERPQQAGGGNAAAGPTAAQANSEVERRDFVINKTMLSRCPMEAWMYSVGRPSVAGTLGAGEREQTFRVSRMGNFGTCFAGSWVEASTGCVDPLLAMSPMCVGGWAWVAGRHHKHHCHFVKVPHGIGIVPVHPLDHKGKQPINAKNGVLVLAEGKRGFQAGVQAIPKDGLHETGKIPSGFEKSAMARAPHVTQPVIQARVVESVAGQGSALARQMGGQEIPEGIQYDYKTKNFVMNSKAGGNGQAASGTEVVAHAGSHGSSVSRTSGNGGGGGSARGSSGGGSSHASSSGSSGGGGGGHSGGGSSGGSASGGGGGPHH